MNASSPADGFGARRVAMLALSTLPLLHAGACVAAFVWIPGNVALRVSSGIAILYLAPPLFFRALTAFASKPEGRIPADSGAFIVWWAGHQSQGLFSRFPALEETLRVIPGAYSVWLRLWGSKIGARTFWTARTTITDRAYLNIGDNVAFGAGVKLNAHVVVRDDDGGRALVLAPVAVGDGALVGGYSLLTAGTTIAPGSVTRALLVSPPFSRWEDDRRRKGTHDE